MPSAESESLCGLARAFTRGILHKKDGLNFRSVKFSPFGEDRRSFPESGPVSWMGKANAKALLLHFWCLSLRGRGV
jgi:hypothetical protein